MKSFLETIKWTDENSKDLSNVALTVLVGEIGLISLLLDRYYISLVSIPIILLLISFLALCITIYFGFIFRQSIQIMADILFDLEQNKELTVPELVKMKDDISSQKNVNKKYQFIQRMAVGSAIIFLLVGAIMGFLNGSEKEQVRHDKLVVTLEHLNQSLNSNLNTLSHRLDTLNIKSRTSKMIHFRNKCKSH